MSEDSLVLLEDAIDVGAGRCAPVGKAADYMRAALEFAASRTAPGEDATEALLRLLVDGHAIIEVLYAAAERA